jgi:hypothetical protein
MAAGKEDPVRRKVVLSALAFVAACGLFLATTAISGWLSARLEAQESPSGGQRLLPVPDAPLHKGR